MIALIDYGAGNAASVSNVLDELCVEYIVTKREPDICKSDKIIFPGVGEASSAIRQLHLYNLTNLLRIIKKPFLGICLGMQLLCEKSKEGNVSCLGVFPITVEKFDASKIKVPHMGWNRTKIVASNKLFTHIEDEDFFYYAHSYYVPSSDYTIALSEHDVPFSAAVQKDNFYGVQFHPEKSGKAGIQIIKNFVELC